MSEQQDAADVSRVLGGDVEAFAGIVRRWQGPLVTLAFRFCRDRGRAEEMAQTAFLKTYRSLEQWHGVGAFSSWLFAVAANVYRSEMRRRSPVALPLSAAQDLVESGAGSSSDSTVERVRAAVSKLPGKYRDALVLYYFHEMDVRETALSLGVAEGTVKARLHRGRAILRKRLGSTSAAPSGEKGTG
jgi:RNA polymerase sigma-70 factor (ECF subfamily)